MAKRDDLTPAKESGEHCPRCERPRAKGHADDCPRHKKFSRVTDGADITIGKGPRVRVVSQSFTLELEENTRGRTSEEAFRVTVETATGLAYSKYEFSTEDAAADYADRVLSAGSVDPRFWFFL